jgi:ABC-2 type transport system permease protein
VTEARIHDAGYRRYDGVRLGRPQAIRSLTRHTVQRVMGLRRPARYKALPFLVVLIAYLPAAVFVGLAAFLPTRLRGELPKLSDYYGFVTAAIVLFVAFVAPESLCPDRRYRTLSLYLAAPLDRLSYLRAKAQAIASILALVTVGPPLLMLVGLSLQNAGPKHPSDLAIVILRILASGLMLSVFYTAISMAVASLTDRRAFAAAFTLIIVAGTVTVAGTLVYALGATKSLVVINLNRVPFELSQRFFGTHDRDLGDVSTAIVVLGALGWFAVGCAVTWWRYQRLQVNR